MNTNTGTGKKNSAGRLFGNTYLSSLCYEFAMLFRAGISAADSMAIIADGESDRKAAAKLRAAADRLQAGILFSEALDATDSFPKYMIDMLHIGEVTGRLESTLSALSDYYDRRERLTRTVRYAVLYPGVLSVLMLAVAVILITRVLPIFAEISQQLGIEQSGAALALTDFGRFISKNFAWLIPAAAALIAAMTLGVIEYYRRGPVGRSIAAARFAAALAMGMSSGLDTDRSLELAEQLCSDSFACRLVSRCREAMRTGESFTDAIAATGLFGGQYNRMLAVGFKTGAADAAMSEIARRYEEMATERTETAAARLEPALVIVMALLVGFILLSVMLPLMSVMSAL